MSDSVLRLYLGLLDRFPSAEELTLGVARYARGTPLSRLATDLLDSTSGFSGDRIFAYSPTRRFDRAGPGLVL